MLSIEKELCVGNYLKSLGIPPHLSGYYNLCTTIGYLLDNPNERPKIMTLYSLCKKKNNGTASQVERSIRTAIEYAFMKTHPDKLYDVFGPVIDPNSGKVTNTTFMYMCVDELRPVWPKKGEE